MGNVDDGIVRPDIRDMFKNSNVYSKEKCKNCFAKFYFLLLALSEFYLNQPHHKYREGCIAFPL